VRTAQQAGLTLIGFARQQDLAVYCHPERVAFDQIDSMIRGRHAY